MRSGRLAAFRVGGAAIDTPAALLYTRGAAVPHLTADALPPSCGALPLLVPLATTAHAVDAVRASGAGLASFAANAPRPTFVSFADPAAAVPPRGDSRKTLPLWTRHGKLAFDADRFVDVVEVFRPNAYSTPCDSAVDDDSSDRRLAEAARISDEMLARCVRRHRQSATLRAHTQLFGSIVGGQSVELRLQSMECALEHAEHLNGFTLAAFDADGPHAETRTFESIGSVATVIAERLPEDKLRFAPGCWNALVALELVIAGWDLFDTSMPYAATERGAALTFSFDGDDESEYEIRLGDDEYAEDFAPISNRCGCMACSKYKRAYINHLVNSKELLGSVLLMIHNLHHYASFFEAIRANIRSDTLTQLRNRISEQYYRTKLGVNLNSKLSPLSEKKMRLL